MSPFSMALAVFVLLPAVALAEDQAPNVRLVNIVQRAAVARAFGQAAYDAPPRACGTSTLAVTAPGSRAILVCGERFVLQMSKNSRHAEATIHETLHSLGLGENPPSTDHINDRVLARCGQR